MAAGTALDLVTLGWQLTYVRQEGDLYHNPAYKLGTHVGITKIGFVEALRSYGKQRPGLPCQLFLQSPTGGSSSERYLPVKDLEEAASLISIYQLTYFTHSPYVINMCKPEPWHLVTLKRELEQTARIGGRGCVVHTGARKELSMAAALDAMAWVVADVAPFASPECRLLLETPAKEGTDTLNTVEEMGQFLSGRFPASIRDRIGICVDTAHVWAAGYNPLDYLQTLERRYPTVYIGLIHFNGSRVKRGSRRDAHWPAGSKGDYIGMATMVAVAAWAAARSVPLVTE